MLNSIGPVGAKAPTFGTLRMTHIDKGFIEKFKAEMQSGNLDIGALANNTEGVLITPGRDDDPAIYLTSTAEYPMEPELSILKNLKNAYERLIIDYLDPLGDSWLYWLGGQNNAPDGD